MKIGDCMKRKVISATSDTSIQTAARLLHDNHIGCLPITNEESQLIGLVRLRDIVTLAMPDFVHLMKNVDFVGDFGAVENCQPDFAVLMEPVSQIMKEPVSVEETAGLIRAITLLQEHKLNDLPVVDENMHLVGIASYVDIGVSLISKWQLS